MAVAFYAEIKDMTTAQAESVLQQLNLNGRSPKGQIHHSEGPLASGGTWVYDIWESEQAFGEFAEKSLGPIATKMGITPPHPKMMPVRVVITPQDLKKF